MISLVSLFNDISTFLDYLMPIFVEEQLWYYLTHSWENKRVYIFPPVYSPKSECSRMTQVQTHLL